MDNDKPYLLGVMGAQPVAAKAVEAQWSDLLITPEGELEATFVFVLTQPLTDAVRHTYGWAKRKGYSYEVVVVDDEGDGLGPIIAGAEVVHASALPVGKLVKVLGDNATEYESRLYIAYIPDDDECHQAYVRAAATGLRIFDLTDGQEYDGPGAVAAEDNLPEDTADELPDAEPVAVDDPILDLRDLPAKEKLKIRDARTLLREARIWDDESTDAEKNRWHRRVGKMDLPEVLEHLYPVPVQPTIFETPEASTEELEARYTGSPAEARIEARRAAESQAAGISLTPEETLALIRSYDAEGALIGRSAEEMAEYAENWLDWLQAARASGKGVRDIGQEVSLLAPEELVDLTIIELKLDLRGLVAKALEGEPLEHLILVEVMNALKV